MPRRKKPRRKNARDDVKRFALAHATHPQWRMAAALVLAQLRAQLALPQHAGAPGLALLYITDHYAGAARDILDHLSAELPEVTDWSGTVGVGVSANNAEYFDEPALSVMLLDVPADQYRVFSGVAPLPRHPASGFVAQTALVHADGHTPDLAELLQEMADRTETGYLFGGLSASRTANVQFAVGGNGNMAGQGGASGVFDGGLSGVAFDAGVALVSRVTQGCQPVGALHTITAAQEDDAARGIGLRIGLGAGLMMVAVIGGRIIPSFTRNWLVRQPEGQARLPAAPMQRFDKAALMVLLLALALPAFEETKEDWRSRGDFAVTFLDRYGNVVGHRGIIHEDSVPFDQLPGWVAAWNKVMNLDRFDLKLVVADDCNFIIIKVDHLIGIFYNWCCI